MRIGVVGAGIVGSCVAWRLARDGADVVVIDRGGLAEGASGSSFAWVNASSVAGDRDYFDFRCAAMAEWQRVVAELGDRTWWHRTGHVRWFDDERSADSAVGFARATGYPVERLDADGASSREPAVAFSADAAVALFPSEGWIDVRRASAALLGDAQRHRAELRTGAQLRSVELADGQPTALVLGDGERLEIDAMVNCAGADADDVAALVGRTLPLVDEPGLIARVRSDGPPVRHVLHTPFAEVRPDGDDRVVLHSRSVDVDVARDDGSELAHRLIEVCAGAVPALSGCEPLDWRVGRRPMPADRYPSIGAVPSIPGYAEAVMHSGVTNAALAAALLAEELLSGRTASRYRPERFADHSRR